MRLRPSDQEQLECAIGWFVRGVLGVPLGKITGGTETVARDAWPGWLQPGMGGAVIVSLAAELSPGGGSLYLPGPPEGPATQR